MLNQSNFCKTKPTVHSIILFSKSSKFKQLLRYSWDLNIWYQPFRLVDTRQQYSVGMSHPIRTFLCQKRCLLSDVHTLLWLRFTRKKLNLEQGLEQWNSHIIVVSDLQCNPNILLHWFRVWQTCCKAHLWLLMNHQCLFKCLHQCCIQVQYKIEQVGLYE